MTTRPSVLFVCVKNGGQSQMAAGLMKDLAGDAVDVRSPGTTLNDASVRSLLAIGVDLTGQQPKALTCDMLQSADVVVTRGREAEVDRIDGTRFENWDTDERGIEGLERMRPVRDDIAARVRTLASDLGFPVGQSGPMLGSGPS